MGALNRFNLKEIIANYGIENFVETGTLWGDSVAFALNFNFKKIISVEIIPKIAAKTQERFTSVENVEIIPSDSETALNTHLPLLKENILFWLDAHFPGADAKMAKYEDGDDSEYRLPLFKELLCIKNHRPNFTDVILIDDLRIYEDGRFENGLVPESAKPKCNRNIDFIYQYFNQTHYIFKSYKDEGYILLFPKAAYITKHSFENTKSLLEAIVEYHYQVK